MNPEITQSDIGKEFSGRIYSGNPKMIIHPTMLVKVKFFPTKGFEGWILRGIIGAGTDHNQILIFDCGDGREKRFLRKEFSEIY